MNAMPPTTDEDISKVLNDYMQTIISTDKLSKENLEPILLGLFGEVGSIMASVKKKRREGEAYIAYHDAVEEEFGDTLWYFTSLCNRLGIGLDKLFHGVMVRGELASDSSVKELANETTSQESKQALSNLENNLLKLGEATSLIIKIRNPAKYDRKSLEIFASSYLQALQFTGIPLLRVIRKNVKKVRGRFIEPDKESLPTFDEEFPEYEQIPKQFDIVITQRGDGHCYLQWNNVFIGDRLTDNIRDTDYYRFHDVFHLSYAAILHWSPVFRALIKHKRRSDPEIDESEDGGRAIVIEEGLTAWLFTHAKRHNYFDGHESISFNLLKTIQEFVQGYEVAACPLKMWENAILSGYEVFRKVRDNRGGIVICNRESRTITYQPIGGIT